MKRFIVIGARGDILKDFDTADGAATYARKGLREGAWSRFVKDREYNRVMVSYRKQNGKVLVRRY